LLFVFDDQWQAFIDTRKRQPGVLTTGGGHQSSVFSYVELDRMIALYMED
jgi:hypothetical protein